MSTAKEVIYNIRNLKSGGKSSDDNTMSDMQWLYVVDYYRSQLIRQQQNQSQSVSSFIEQELELDLVLSDIDDELFESQPIPKPIELHRKDLITHVGNDDEIGYQRQTFNNYLWKKYSRYTKHLSFWFTKDSKVFVGNLGGNKRVVIRGVFERPIDVVKLNGAYNHLDPLDFEYPVSSNILDSIIKMIADAEMKILHMLPQDSKNDGQDLT